MSHLSTAGPVQLSRLKESETRVPCQLSTPEVFLILTGCNSFEAPWTLLVALLSGRPACRKVSLRLISEMINLLLDVIVLCGIQTGLQ